MLGLKTLSNPAVSVITIPRQWCVSQIHTKSLSIRIKPSTHKPRKISVSANSKGNANESDEPSNSNGESDGNGIGSDDDVSDESKAENGLRGLNLRWAQLLLDPDPDNLLAVGLTGLLTWASVQVVWQLLVVSLAIIVAGLKYSLVAALLIFILIALL